VNNSRAGQRFVNQTAIQKIHGRFVEKSTWTADFLNNLRKVALAESREVDLLSCAN
jgi:hypothetical protein